MKNLKLLFIAVATFTVMTSCEKEDFSNLENEELLTSEELLIEESEEDDNDVLAKASRKVTLTFKRCLSACPQKQVVKSGGGVQGTLKSSVDNKTSYIKIKNPISGKKVKLVIFENRNFTGKRQTFFKRNSTRATTFSVNASLYDKISSYKMFIIND
ncbi:hypothetical protein ACWGOQ_0000015 [Aquimarina sp. M1]